MTTGILPEDESDDRLWADADATVGVARGELLFQLARRLEARGASTGAAAAAEAAAAAFLEDGRVDLASSAALESGLALWSAGVLDGALHALDDAYELCSRVDDGPGMAKAREVAGQVLAARGDGDGAVGRYREAEDILLADGAGLRAASVAMRRGELLGSLGRREEALQVFEGARLAFRGEPSPLDVATCDDRIAAALIELGRLPDALERLHAALHVWEAADDKEHIAYAAYRLGWTLVIAGQDDEALVHLEQARRLYQELGDLLGAVRCEHQAAGALVNLGRAEHAVQLYTRVCAVFDAHGADHELLIAESNLADALADQGRVHEAIAARRSLLHRARERGDRFVAAGVSTRLAADLVTIGEPEQALAVLEEPARYFARNDDHLEGSRFLAVRADALLAAGHVAGAREAAGEVLDRLDRAALPEQHARALEVLAHCELRTGTRADGEHLLAQAIALYLAVGLEDKARQLSALLLPAQPQRAPRATPDRTRSQPAGPYL